MAERALEMMCTRAAERKTFGKRLLRHVSLRPQNSLPFYHVHKGLVPLHACLQQK